MEATALSSSLTPRAGRLDGTRGFSLVEVLVSIMVLLVLMLALMSAAVLSMGSNLRDIVRDYGTVATQDVLNNLLSKRFDDSALDPIGPPGMTVVTTRRAGTKEYVFTTTYTITQSPTDTNFKSVQALTTWTFNGQINRHSATIVIKR